MTKATINFQAPEAKRNQIAHLLERLTQEYQQGKTERRAIATLERLDSEEFTVLEEMELLTTEIRGFASQLQARGLIESSTYAIEQLQQCQVFDRPAIAQFYFNPHNHYPQTKAYLRTLDYLRLVLLDHLTNRYRLNRGESDKKPSN